MQDTQEKTRDWPIELYGYGKAPDERWDAPALQLAYDCLDGRPDRIRRVLQLRALHCTFRQIAEVCYRIWKDGRQDFRSNQLAGAALVDLASGLSKRP